MEFGNFQRNLFIYNDVINKQQQQQQPPFFYPFYFPFSFRDITTNTRIKGYFIKDGFIR